MSTKTIAIIDDDVEYTQMLDKRLKREGYETLVFDEPLSALDELDCGAKPDLILLDFMMPNMSGIEVLQEIQKRHPNEFKVCMLTAKNCVRDVDEAFTYGAYGYILKTSDIILLYDKIYHIIHERDHQNYQYISQLEVTNIINHFKIIERHGNNITIDSSEELPLNAIIQLRDQELKEITGGKETAICIVEDCHIIDDHIKITCEILNCSH